MRFKHYFVKTPSALVHKVAFEDRHYRSKGLMSSSLGMPLVEAYELVNEFNAHSAQNESGNYTYWLEKQ